MNNPPTGCNPVGPSWRINVYRLSSRDGQVEQLLRPTDMQDLVKLCQVLAATLADDGCIPTRQRCALANLAAKLDGITRTET